jgi:hypothetical protein
MRVIESPHSLSSIIRRTVIHDNNLNALWKRSKRSHELATSVERRDYYGYLRNHTNAINRAIHLYIMTVGGSLRTLEVEGARSTCLDVIPSSFPKVGATEVAHTPRSSVVRRFMRGPTNRALSEVCERAASGSRRGGSSL